LISSAPDDKKFSDLPTKEGTQVFSSHRAALFLVKGDMLKDDDKQTSVDVMENATDPNFHRRYHIKDGGFALAVVYWKKSDAAFATLKGELDKAIVGKATKAIDKTLSNGYVVRMQVLQANDADEALVTSAENTAIEMIQAIK
jgi:hypothetical protein